MDSHLIAGAYSQHFRAIQIQETLIDSDRLDAITRAKRLSQETNRRRRLQAHKRKVQVKREEKRRLDILTRRREEQRHATEKYQRYHLPPSARQSYRFMPRKLDGLTLDNALQLIRGIQHPNRPISSHEKFLLQANENDNSLDVSNSKPRPHSTRPGLGRFAHQLNSRERAELMDNSKQNLTASKTLFEQQLEQQQNLLLEQQQQSLREFHNAVHYEVDGDKTFGKTISDPFADSDTQGSEGNITHSDSCSSLDSLDESKDYTKPSNPGQKVEQLRQKPFNIDHGYGNEQNINLNKISSSQHQQQTELQQQQNRFNILDVPGQQNNLIYSQNQNVTTFAVSQKNASSLETPNSAIGLTSDYTNTRPQHGSYNGLKSNRNVLGNNGTVISGNQKVSLERNYQIPLKQFSTDSLESCSSSSSISVVKLQGIEGEPARAVYSIQPEGTESGSKFYISHLKNDITGRVGNYAESSHKLQYSDKIVSKQQNAVSATTDSSVIQKQQGQMAWISPTTQANTTAAFTDIPALGNENKLIIDNFQPRYASAIGSSIWPDCNVQGQMPASVANTNSHPFSSVGPVISVTAAPSIPTSFPDRPMPNVAKYSKAGSRVDTEANIGTLGNETLTVSATSAVSNNGLKNEYGCSDKHPQIHDNLDLGNIYPYSSQIQQLQIKVPSTDATQGDTGSIFASSKQMIMQVPTAQNFPSGGSQVSINPQHQRQDTGVQSSLHQNPKYYNEELLNDRVPTSTMPISAVRKNIPTSRPPSPVINTTAVILHTNTLAVETGARAVNPVDKNDIAKITRAGGSKDQTHYITKKFEEEDVFVDEEDSEELRPLKGILKQATLKIIPQNQEKAVVSKPKLRDSLELAHLQNGKKTKKKSVRFAGHEVDEDDNEDDETAQYDNSDVTNAGESSYKSAFNRPLSAKVVSTTTKPETGMRVQRALSAGAHRQQPVMSEHIQIRNVQQMSSTSVPVSTGEGTIAACNNILGPRSNLPSSFVTPLNTTLINRPKAAAHIIMSTDVRKEAPKGYDVTYTGPVTVHKSQLETKIRSVNNNFMSKVPVKIPTSRESNAVVYNVAYAHAEGNSNSNADTDGTHITAEDNVHQASRALQQQNFDKSRNAYSGSKRVAFSNSGVKGVSAVPASTKVTYPQSSDGPASFSTSTGNAKYDETGMRIDRTPTDDEITWLWDKVRNCLNREGGNKSHAPANGNNDQGPRQPPTLSTKLIDGASLGFGTNQNGSNGAMTSVRPGSGFFHPRATPASNTQDTVRPVIQQQGSYLRRYGLLKQRRAYSASAVRNNSGPEGQRANSVVFGRTSTIQPHQPLSATGQPQQRDIPTPMTFGYKPQDEVSESTAAFIMAERLAKQSLSDSQIKVAMDDAQSKQEAYNRSKMMVAHSFFGKAMNMDFSRPSDGHSALSIEEQKLLESLDRLNEKLKEPGFKGTIHYHQPTQAQLTGFQGYKPIIDARRHMLMAPETKQRAQSARTRQQTHQYK